ncbi:MAG: GDP-L-fucose synthase family protein [Gammaproteobacteria bacterium]
MLEKSSKIYVAGHRGLVGSAITRLLKNQGYHHLLLKTHAELDLTNQNEVQNFFSQEKPEYVFLAAAKVGGIHANNTYRGEFIYENLMIQSNVIEAARLNQVKRLLFLGSSCIYPRDCPQPMSEQYLLSSYLEKTNEPYAIAKIAGIILCESYHAQYGCDFRSVMPTNLYGPNDNFDLENSHVLPALLRKFHQAKQANLSEVIVWGRGTPKREFLHVDDMAQACLFVMNQPEYIDMINVGSSEEISIRELANIIAKVVGFNGNIVFDTNKPDGTPRKLLDCTRLNQLGWKSAIRLHDGIQMTYNWLLGNASIA